VNYQVAKPGLRLRDALELTQDFGLASYTRQGWILDRETLEKGSQPTQYKK